MELHVCLFLTLFPSQCTVDLKKIKPSGQTSTPQTTARIKWWRLKQLYIRWILCVHLKYLQTHGGRIIQPQHQSCTNHTACRMQHSGVSDVRTQTDSTCYTLSSSSSETTEEVTTSRYSFKLAAPLFIVKFPAPLGPYRTLLEGNGERPEGNCTAHSKLRTRTSVTHYQKPTYPPYSFFNLLKILKMQHHSSHHSHQ